MTAIILLNYNNWRDTIECLESLFKIEGERFKIILVDNSTLSSDINNIIDWAKGNITVQETLFPDLVFPCERKPILFKSIQESDIPELLILDEDLLLIRANENRGFAAGNNIGIRAGLHLNLFDFFWILNNDTVIKKDSLKSFVNYHGQYSNVGIIGSKLMHYYEPYKVQAIGGVLNSFLGTTKHITDLNLLERVSYPIGASLFVSSDYVEKVGFLNEAYFLYYEELDWVYRGFNYGYQFAINCDSEIYHKEGASINGKILKKSERSEVSDLSSLRSRLIFMKLHFPHRLIIAKFGFIIVVINRLLRGQFRIIKKIIKLIKSCE